MAHDAEDRRWSPERYRAYLHLLARQHIAASLRGKFDTSDLVQQTLLQAHQRQGQFRGQSEGEWKAWLREMLANILKNKLAEFGSQKRDLGREQSLAAALADTSARLENWAVANGPSPSDEAQRHERLQQLAEALSQLPQDQRQALELRHLHDCSVAQISQQMGRTEAAVAGLIRRGMKKLRELLGDRP